MKKATDEHAHEHATHDMGRRDFVILMGSAAAASVFGCGGTSAPTATSIATPAPSTAASPLAGATSCAVRPALTEGPYFVDEKLNRSDIRSDPSTNAVKPGATLALAFLVSKVSGSACSALPNATVDVWHCDALGVYSDATDPGFGSTKGTKFLRGFQTTDANGSAKFTTIWPGWYQGRAVHIHFKIRTTAAGGAVSDFTSQLFFDDALNAQVFAQAPYSQKGSTGWMKNAQDGIYTGGGDKLLLKPTQTGSGYTATFDIGLA